MKIKQALLSATDELKSLSDTPRLDLEILLAHVLDKNRAYLYTYPEQELNKIQLKKFDDYIKMRASGCPIAYIVGYKEFWSHQFIVNQHTLIPRAETETLLEAVLENLDANQQLKILELGTGSGAITISLALERPNWNFIATDISSDTLDIAKKNAKLLQVNNIKFVLSNWFENINEQNFNAILSNPPYIGYDDPYLEKNTLKFEPQQALISNDDGYHDLKTIISQSKKYLKSQGMLFLEHGFAQKDYLLSFMEKNNFNGVNDKQDIFNKDRIIYGKK